MDNLNERILAYHLATSIECEEVDTVAGGSIRIIIPTVALTGDPLSPDVSVDS